MDVTVNVTEQDVIALNDHLVRTVPRFRRQMLTSHLGVATLFALLGAFLSHLSRNWRAGLIFFLTAAIWLIGFPLYIRWCRRRNVRMLLATGRNLGMFGEHRITVDPKGVTNEHRYGFGGMYWPAIERIETGPKHGFVFISAMQAYVLPRRDFASENEFDLFIETARRYHREAQAELAAAAHLEPHGVGGFRADGPVSSLPAARR